MRNRNGIYVKTKRICGGFNLDDIVGDTIFSNTIELLEYAVDLDAEGKLIYNHYRIWFPQDTVISVEFKGRDAILHYGCLHIKVSYLWIIAHHKDFTTVLKKKELDSITELDVKLYNVYKDIF